MILQPAARKACTIIAGVSESGKSTLALWALLLQGFNCRFIFDPEGEFADRLGLLAAETEAELDCACAEGFAIFDPHALFPGALQDAAEWFMMYAFNRSTLLGGRNVLLLDEAWKYQHRTSVPHAHALCVQTGRKRGLEMIFCTQLPHLLNGSIVNEWTECVCFNLAEPKALEWAAARGFNPEEVAALPMGALVARHKSGGERRGRLVF